MSSEPYDPSRFIEDTVKPLIEKNRAIRSRIITARKWTSNRMIARVNNLSDKLFKQFPDIPQDCVINFEVSNSNSSIASSIPHPDMDKILRERRIPTPKQILQIALGNGLTGAEREDFIAKGNAYIEYRNSLVLQASSEPAATPPLPEEEPQDLPGILDRIIKSRWQEKGSGMIYRELPKYANHVSRLSISHLLQYIGIHSGNERTLYTCFLKPEYKSPKDAQDIQKHKARLTTILNGALATDKEREAVFTAFDALVEKSRQEIVGDDTGHADNLGKGKKGKARGE